MKVIVCLDDNNGMLFNKRRQSQDKAVRLNMINHLHGQKLWMNEYSAKQFEESFQDSIAIDENPVENAGKADYCFAENFTLSPYEEKISTLIIYRWNRKYPADMCLDMDLSNWKAVHIEEFPGNSHEKITREEYIRGITGEEKCKR